MCGRIILRHAVAIQVHDAEVEQCTGVPLFGRQTIPAHGFCVVLRHAFADDIHVAKAVLGIREPLFG